MKLCARAVFFVRDAARALDFYSDKLGFALDWGYEHDGRPYVFQVSLLGFELIINQAGADTEDRPGHGRVFIGLEGDQSVAFRRHLKHKRIRATVVGWGEPTLAIQDPDGNELFFWLPETERAALKVGDAYGGEPEA